VLGFWFVPRDPDFVYEELHAKAQEDYDTASATREGQIMAKAANAAPTVASGTESDAKNQLDSIAERLKEAIKARSEAAARPRSRNV
jgi:hypothetical protein